MSKISVFTNYFPPEIGAASYRIFDMVKGLKRSGHQVKVYTAMPNYPEGKVFKKYKANFFKKEWIEDIEIRRHWIYATHSDNKLARLMNMVSISLSSFFSLFDVLKNKPDIIIVQYPPIALPLVSLLFARLTKAHFIINISDIWPSAIVDLGIMKKGLAYKILDNIETFLYDNAVLCMAQSEEIISHIKSKSETNTILYRTGVDCNLFDKKEIYEIKDSKLKIIYAGVMGIAHGLLSLIQNIDFKKIGVELHIYGDGFEKKKIINYLSDNQNAVFLHDFVSKEDMPGLLKKFDAALISQKTSVLGTVPSKMYEALASGLPVLYNGKGEGAAIIEKNTAGFASDPEVPNELIENINKLKHLNTSEKELMGERGRIAAETLFDRKVFIKQLVEVLDKDFN